MKNVFFISLQRVGSNFVEVVLNQNTEGLAFRGYMLDGNNMMTKHCFPEDVDTLQNAIIPQDEFVIIVKNPYMWVESVCWNTEMSKETQKKLWFGDFEAYKVQENGELNGYNLSNLVNMYKDFYTKWFDYAKGTNIQTVRYEDFLDKDKARDICEDIVSKIGEGKVKSNFKLHDKPIRFSMGFTKEDFDYYKAEKPKKISKSNINTINKVLGSSFIESLGYKVIT